MPRWPEKDKLIDETSEQGHSKVIPISDNMALAPGALEEIINRLAGIEALLTLPDPEPYDNSLKITQRHGQREALAALRKLSSGQVRPPDDDSEQVLTDVITELMFWRGVNNELLQAFRSSEQRVLLQLRRLTER